MSRPLVRYAQPEIAAGRPCGGFQADRVGFRVMDRPRTVVFHSQPDGRSVRRELPDPTSRGPRLGSRTALLEDLLELALDMELLRQGAVVGLVQVLDARIGFLELQVMRCRGRPLPDIEPRLLRSLFSRAIPRLDAPGTGAEIRSGQIGQAPDREMRVLSPHSFEFWGLLPVVRAADRVVALPLSVGFRELGCLAVIYPDEVSFARRDEDSLHAFARYLIGFMSRLRILDSREPPDLGSNPVLGLGTLATGLGVVRAGFGFREPAVRPPLVAGLSTYLLHGLEEEIRRKLEPFLGEQDSLVWTRAGSTRDGCARIFLPRPTLGEAVETCEALRRAIPPGPFPLKGLPSHIPDLEVDVTLGMAFLERFRGQDLGSALQVATLLSQAARQATGGNRVWALPLALATLPCGEDPAREEMTVELIAHIRSLPGYFGSE